MGMLMPSIWLGAAAGAGKSMQDMGIEAIKAGNEERRDAMKAAAELAKEKRIAEAHDARLKTAHDWEVQGKTEDRAYATKHEAETFALNNSPDRISAQANAANQLSKATLTQEMEALKQKEAITYHAPPDHTDYAGRKLDNDLTQAKLTDFNSPEAIAARAQGYKDATGDGHLTDAQKSSAKAYLDHARDLATENQRLIIAKASADKDQAKAIDDQIGANKLAQNTAYQAAHDIFSAGKPVTPSASNPAGILDKPKPEDKGMIALPPTTTPTPVTIHTPQTDTEEINKLSNELTKNYGIDTKGKSLDQLRRIKFSQTNPGQPFRYEY